MILCQECGYSNGTITATKFFIIGKRQIDQDLWKEVIIALCDTHADSYQRFNTVTLDEYLTSQIVNS
jgi:hypothetical protein